MIGKLTVKYKEVPEGADRIMGGYIIRTEIDDILEKGVQRGMQQGIQRGMQQGKTEQAKEIAARLDRKGRAAEDIAEIVGFDIDTVKTWLAGKEV